MSRVLESKVFGPTGNKLSQPDPEVNAISFEAEYVKNNKNYKVMAYAYPDFPKKFGEGSLHVRINDKDLNPLSGTMTADKILKKDLISIAFDVPNRTQALDIFQPRR